ARLRKNIMAKERPAWRSPRSDVDPRFQIGPCNLISRPAVLVFPVRQPVLAFQLAYPCLLSVRDASQVSNRTAWRVVRNKIRNGDFNENCPGSAALRARPAALLRRDGARRVLSHRRIGRPRS